MDRLAIAVSAPKRPGEMNTGKLEARLATDANWSGGHCYRAGGILATMTRIREETLRRYGLEEELAPRFPDAPARGAELSRIARDWAQAFDQHSLLVLGRASEAFDATPMLGRIKARGSYALSRADLLFPPSLAPAVMAAMTSAGVVRDILRSITSTGILRAERTLRSGRRRWPNSCGKPGLRKAASSVQRLPRRAATVLQRGQSPSSWSIAAR